MKTIQKTIAFFLIAFTAGSHSFGQDLLAVNGTNTNASASLMSESDDEKTTAAAVLAKKIHIVNQNSNSFDLVYLDKKEEKVFVTIKNSNDETIFRSKLKNKNGFSRTYDMSNLDEGDYTLILENENGVRVEKAVKIEKPEAKKGFESEVVGIGEDKTYQLTVVNNIPDRTKFQVRIFDDNGQQIYSKFLRSETGFKQAFDLNEFDSESFSFVINHATGMQEVSIQ